MARLEIERSARAYRWDFAFYALASTLLGLAALVAAPPGHGLSLALWAIAGFPFWTLLEYLLHRFVLHGLPPFSRWHAQHHLRPTALIATPTWLSDTLLVTGAALPAWALLGPWRACALMAGLLGGYLAYGLTHHAVHHALSLPGPGQAWLSRRRRGHALHHRGADAAPANYGVTQDGWDRVFGTLAATPLRP